MILGTALKADWCKGFWYPLTLGSTEVIWIIFTHWHLLLHSRNGKVHTYLYSPNWKVSRTFLARSAPKSYILQIQLSCCHILEIPELCQSFLFCPPALGGNSVPAASVSAIFSPLPLYTTPSASSKGKGVFFRTACLNALLPMLPCGTSNSSLDMQKVEGMGRESKRRRKNCRGNLLGKGDGNKL